MGNIVKSNNKYQFIDCELIFEELQNKRYENNLLGYVILILLLVLIILIKSKSKKEIR